MRWLVVLTICASVSVSRADGTYFTEGFGGTNIKDDLGQTIPSALRMRISVGHRFQHWAVEGFFSGHFNLAVDTAPYDSGHYNYPPNLLTFGVDVKYIEPLSQNLEVYLRGSLSEGGTDHGLDGYFGRGAGFGAGIQLKGRGSVWGLLYWPLFWIVKKGPKMTGALWLDTGYEYYRLHGKTPGDVMNAQLSHITLGYAVGTDF